jgi:predicted naringenin-chalcone synthase
LVVEKTLHGKMFHDQSGAYVTQTDAKPLEPEIRDSLRELVDTSHDGLVEEKTDRGVEVNLKGKFRTAPVATINEDGELTVRDYTSPPAR